MRKIYLDVTDTVQLGLNTGIQRVVRRIVQEGAAVGHEFEVELIPVISLGERIVTLNESGNHALHTPKKEVFGLGTNELISGYKGLKDFLKAFPGPYQFVRRKLSERRNFGGLIGPAITTFEPGDCLVLLDAFWNPNSAIMIAGRMTRRRVPTICVIYDMIPVTNPEMFDNNLPELFATRLAALVKLGVKFVAISNDAGRKALEYANRYGYQGKINTFYLGFDVPANKPSADDDAAWPDGLWSGSGPVHLMVGTIEPRKGHDVALDATERLWAEGRDDRLLIIGRIGWLADDLLDRVRKHPEYGRRLFMVHGANDAMLSQAYRQATDCIVASRSEGFGLPLVEALACSLPVMASDIDVFREIAPDTALFFRSGDGADLARAMRQMADERDVRQQAAQAFEWIDWRESARQFIRGVLDQASGEALPVTAPVPPLVPPQDQLPV